MQTRFSTEFIPLLFSLFFFNPSNQVVLEDGGHHILSWGLLGRKAKVIADILFQAYN